MDIKLTVIIPCYNEATNIPVVIPEVVKKCDECGWKLVIVDDGSQDNSANLLSAFVSEKVKVVRHKLNRGYGGAIKTGIQIADTDYIVTIDADGQHYLDDITQLFNQIIKTNADMVVGGRPTGSYSQSGWYRNLGKFLIRSLIKIIMDVPVRDQNSGMKLYRRDLALENLNLCPDNMAYSDIILLLFVDSRHLVLEEPIRINSRLGGVSTISTRTAFDTVSEIFYLVVMFHPMKIFIPLALFFFATGSAWVIRGLCYGVELSNGASFLLMTGINCVLLGLIAEQFRRTRR
jgi:glycosyltransferase involved in cell wall biosynthesis